jgi:hypothetical protein
MLQWWADFLDANREKGLRRLTMQRSIAVGAIDALAVNQL